MKRIIDEQNGTPLENLLGERVTFFCCRYIYTGKLIAIDHRTAILSEAGIVYETGELNTGDWKDMQKLPNDWNINLESVESYGVLK